MSDSIKLKLKNNLRSSNKKLLKQDITNNCPQLWNKLPITVINENNTNTLKSKLHKYLLDIDCYTLIIFLLLLNYQIDLHCTFT